MSVREDPERDNYGGGGGKVRKLLRQPHRELGSLHGSTEWCPHVRYRGLNSDPKRRVRVFPLGACELICKYKLRIPR